jgi:hypothetical protein
MFLFNKFYFFIFTMGTGKGGNVLDVSVPVRLIRIIDIGTHAISYFRF